MYISYQSRPIYDHISFDALAQLQLRPITLIAVRMYYDSIAPNCNSYYVLANRKSQALPVLQLITTKNHDFIWSIISIAWRKDALVEQTAISCYFSIAIKTEKLLQLQLKCNIIQLKLIAILTFYQSIAISSH